MSRNKYDGYYEEKDRYVMLDFAIPLGNTVSVGVSHNRDTGTALNVSASRQFEGDYLKSATANVSKAFNSRRSQRKRRRQRELRHAVEQQHPQRPERHE